jgi:hypothetical protein
MKLSVYNYKEIIYTHDISEERVLNIYLYFQQILSFKYIFGLILDKRQVP